MTTNHPGTTVVTQLSLRYDADPEGVAEWAASVIAATGTGLATTTESKSRALTRAMRRALGPGYKVIRQHEYLIIYRRDEFTTRSIHLTFVTALAYWMMGSLSRRFRVATANLTHVSGKRVRAQVSHAPSGVSAGPGVWNPEPELNRVKAAKRGFRHWGARVLRYRAKHPNHVQVINMDSNLDVSKVAWALYLEATFDAPTCWHDHPQEVGSHGARLIDLGIVYGAQVVTARVVTGRRPEGIDHRPITYTIAWA